MQKSQLLSLATFGKALGVSYQAVQGWIKKDRLTVGKGLARVAKGKPKKIKLIPACKELLDNLDSSQPASQDLFNKLTILTGGKLPEHKSSEPEGETVDEIGLSYSEARRKKENIAADMAQVVLDEKRKTLVSAEKVKKKIYSYGVEIRQALEAVPAKVIDNVMASETRNEGLLIIKDAIEKALQKIHDVQKRKL